MYASSLTDAICPWYSPDFDSVHASDPVSGADGRSRRRARRAAPARAPRRRPSASRSRPARRPPSPIEAFLGSLEVELAGHVPPCCVLAPPPAANDAGTSGLLVALSLDSCDAGASAVDVRVHDGGRGTTAERRVGLGDIPAEARPRALALATAELVHSLAQAPPAPPVAAPPTNATGPAATPPATAQARGLGARSAGVASGERHAALGPGGVPGRWSRALASGARSPVPGRRSRRSTSPTSDTTFIAASADGRATRSRSAASSSTWAGPAVSAGAG